MPKPLVLLLALLLALGILPASAEEAPESVIDCGPDASRELLTAEGFERTVHGATALADPADVRDATDDRTVPWRNSELHFRVDIAPVERARGTFDLTWADAGDFDLHVIDADTGFALGVSENAQELEGFSELVRVNLRHCQNIIVRIRNYAAPPGAPLELTASLSNLTGTLTCVEGDTADVCAGKEAGEAPEPREEDRRTFHFLSGTPGQASMPHQYAADTAAATGEVNPFRPATVAAAPDSPVPNSYTRPVFGFNDQSRNPFIPWFPVDFEERTLIEGDVSALVYVSSPTLAGSSELEADPGVLSVDLWSDGGLVRSIKIPGEEIRDVPTPLFVTFEGVRFNVSRSLHLQIGTEPAASTNGEGKPAHATHTVWYDSVQFPSRITLPQH